MDLPELFAPEEKLLIACAEAGEGGARARRVRELASGPLDWSRLLDAAGRHGLLQILRLRLREARPIPLPDAIDGRLRREFQRQGRGNLFLAGELVQLSRLLRQRGLTAISFKGPILALRLYGNLALRPFDDLDFLVPKEELPAFAEALAERGYRLEHPVGHVVRAAPRLSLGLVLPEVHFIREREGFTVDAHVSALCGDFAPGLEMGGITDRMVTTTLFGEELRTLGDRDLLLYLCAHGAKHLWERLSHVSDVSRTLEACPDMDWKGFLRSAREQGLGRVSALGLSLAERLLHPGLSEPVRSFIGADPAVVALSDRHIRLLALSGPSTLPASSRLLMSLRMRERLRDRIRYVWRTLTGLHVADCRSLRLSPRYFALYRVLRPFRLLCGRLRGIRS